MKLVATGMGFLQSSLPFCRQVNSSSLGVVEQVRSYYVDWRMVRDVKRRQMAFEYADTRLRINAIRKNTVLPKELQVCSKSCSFHSTEVYIFRLFSMCMFGFFFFFFFF
uniref:Mitochondrial ribosomal protein S14 n=1 Tax=Sinocyclocheilus grahami TaxID=75366 RepID=A0A672KAA7_SINGR